MNMNPLFRFSRWDFKKKALPYWCVLGWDSLIVLGSFTLVYLLNHGLTHAVSVSRPLMTTLLLFWACYLVGFRVFHTYMGIIRYSSFVDLQRVTFASLLSVALIIVVRIPTLDWDWLVLYNRKAFYGGALLALVGMWMTRVFVKYLYDMTFQARLARRVFIYGVKNGGISLAKSLRNGEPSDFRLAGFVSDFEDLNARMLMGVRVYNNDEHLVEHMRERHARILLVSPLKNDAFREIYLAGVIVRHTVSNTSALRMLLKQVAESIGQPLSFTRLTKMVKEAGMPIAKNTCISYLQYACESSLVLPISNIVGKLQERESSQKYYFVDNGFIRLLKSDPKADQLENLVALHLLRRHGFNDRVFFYRPKQLPSEEGRFPSTKY